MRIILFIISFLMVSITFGQEQYRGVVVDQQNDELPGVKIQNLSTKKYARSTISGEFSIQAKKNDNIQYVFSFYDTLVVIAGKDIKINGLNRLIMRYETQEMGEVM